MRNGFGRTNDIQLLAELIEVERMFLYPELRRPLDYARGCSLQGVIKVEDLPVFRVQTSK
jgi:hypothetical protein